MRTLKVFHLHKKIYQLQINLLIQWEKKAWVVYFFTLKMLY